GHSPGRLGNQHPSIAPYETLRCGQGLLAVACGNDGQFRRLVGALGIPVLIEDERFSTNSARVANRSALVPLLETALTKRSAAEWVPLLNTAGVPAGQVGSVADGFAFAAALGLKPTVEMPTPHPAQVSNPVQFTNAELRHPLPPPDLGSDDGAMRAWLASPGAITQLEDLLSSKEVK
ncbi:CoA transferase, partial [Nocardioides sp. GCM10030258]|uniref:CoA transferase n=1 Tax=unclassified Nocardioides TaxID=2615069 RepID=UPI00361C4AE6